MTSSNTVAGQAAAGSGCSPDVLGRVVAVVKAYTTRVGSGPFPTELFGTIGDYLQEKGGEYGATTGRKRRCGWLDLALLRESARLSGPTDIALTKLDVLSGLYEIKICIGYRYLGKVYEYPPQEEGALEHVEPIYETMPGWGGRPLGHHHLGRPAPGRPGIRVAHRTIAQNHLLDPLRRPRPPADDPPGIVRLRRPGGARPLLAVAPPWPDNAAPSLRLPRPGRPGGMSPPGRRRPLSV